MARWGRTSDPEVVRDLWTHKDVPLADAIALGTGEVKSLRQAWDVEGAEWGDRLSEAESDLATLEGYWTNRR